MSAVKESWTYIPHAQSVSLNKQIILLLYYKLYILIIRLILQYLIVISNVKLI